MEPAIDVLMPTYNGARFLRPMLDSVLGQKKTPIRLYVRDDSSADETLNILDRYAQENDCIEVLSGARLNVVANINALMTRSEQIGSAYFALADQDDIWFPDKIARQYALMQSLEQHHGAECPILLYADAHCVDERGTMLAPSFLQQMGIPQGWGRDLRQALVMSPALGCTCMGNAALRRMALPLPQGENIFMHDWWLLLVACCFGVAHCQPEPLVAYRQHSANVFGIPKTRRLRQMLLDSQTNAQRTQRQAAEFLKRYADRMDSAQREIVHAWAQMPPAPRVRRLWQCWRAGFGKPGLRWLTT